MPHLTLEYSANLVQQFDQRSLMLQCHRVLAKTAQAAPESCQSRIVKQTHFVVGDGSSDNAFIHLHVLLAEGRTPEIKEALAEQLLALLQAAFQPSLETHDLQISVFCEEFERRFYSKVHKRIPHS